MIEGNSRPGRHRPREPFPLLSGRRRARPCCRAGHLRHPANPVHPVFLLPFPLLSRSVIARVGNATGLGNDRRRD